MFKKLKDRIAEQSPLKLPASVQQFAQAVVNSTSSAVPEPITLQQQLPVDPFSIGDDLEETPQNSPARVQPVLQNVDLRDTSLSPSSMYSSPLPNMQFSGTRSRRSSIGSATSEASSIFGLLDTPTSPPFHIQSDWESTASEEGSGAVLEAVSKEQLLGAYRGIQARYHKYKGRYTDLARHYRQLERDLTKTKSVLATSQDKALRRISELKEQCQLEQRAKAHLEEALRNDLEEKDLVISAMHTKFEILKSGGQPNDSKPDPSSHNNFSVAGELNGSREEVLTLRDKVSSLEATQIKFRDALRQYKERTGLLAEEKSQIEQERDAAKKELAALSEQAAGLRRQEEEASLSLAENKQQIHVELEAREMEVRRLQASLSTLASERDQLAIRARELQEGNAKAVQVQPLILAADSELEGLRTKLAETERQLQELRKTSQSAAISLQCKEDELLLTRDEVAKMESKMQEGIDRLQYLQASKTDHQELQEQLQESRNLLQDKENELKSTVAHFNELKIKIVESSNVSDEIIKQLKSEIKQIKEETEKANQDHQQHKNKEESVLKEMQRLKEENKRISQENERIAQEQKSKFESLKDRNEKIKDKLLQVATEREETQKMLEESTANLTATRNKLKSVTAEQEEEVNNLKHGKQYVEAKMEDMCKQLHESSIKLQNLAQEKSEMESKYEDTIRKIQETKQNTDINFQENFNSMQKLVDEKEELSKITSELETEISQLREQLVIKESSSQEGVVTEFQNLLDKLLLSFGGDHCANLSELKQVEKWQIVMRHFQQISLQNSALVDEKDSLLKSIEDNKEKISTVEKQLQVISSDKDNLHKELDKLETSESVNKMKLQESHQQLEVYKNELNQAKTQKIELEKRIGKFESENEETEKQMKYLKSKIEELLIANESVESYKNKSRTEHELMQSKNLELTKKIDEISVVNTNLQSKLNDANKHIQEIESELEILQAEMKKNQGGEIALNELEKALSDAKNRIQNLEKELQEAQSSLGETNTACENLLSQNNHDTQVIAELSVDLRKLQDKEKIHLNTLEKNKVIIQNLKVQNENLCAETCTLERCKDEIFEELEVLKNGNQQITDQLQHTKQTLEETKEELEAIITERSNIELQLENAKSKISELVKELQESKIHSQNIETKVKDYENELSLLKTDLEDCKTKYETQLTEIHQQLQNYKSKLKTSATHLQESESKCKSLGSELEECQSKYETQLEEINVQLQVFKAKYKNASVLAHDYENKVAIANKELEDSQLKYETQLNEMFKQAEGIRNERESLVLELSEMNRQLEEMHESQESAEVAELQDKLNQMEQNHKTEILFAAKKSERELFLLQEEMGKMEEEHKKAISLAVGDSEKELSELKENLEYMEETHNSSLLMAVEDSEKELFELREKIVKMKEEHLAALNVASKDSEKELSELRERMIIMEEEHKAAIKLSTSNSEAKLNELQAKVKEDHNAALLLAAENSEREMLELLKKIKKLEEKLLVSDNSEVKLLKLQENIAKMEEENKSALLLAASNSEAKLLELQEKISKMEEDYNMQLKLLVRDYETQLAQRDQDHQQELDERSDREEIIEAHAVRQIREQNRELRQETKDTEIACENQIMDLQDSLKKAEAALQAAQQEVGDEARRWQQRLVETERQARSALDAELTTAEARHKEQLEGMIKEWQFERKSLSLTSSNNQELERTSQLALAAMESSSASAELLQRQLMAQARQSTAAHATQESSGTNLDPALEISYLRNVLYEYMMGKQPLVLAKVIAAVAKFDPEQTSRVLQKEEQKQTLLGQIGLL